MKSVLTITILAVTTLLVQSEEDGHPSVAFVCNLPAMYSTEKGHAWVKDDSTGCLKDPADILNYCRKVFPDLDVRNVVESGEKVTISNWCDFGVTMCNKELTVVPYRCLVGAFQSDALLVPEHCVFDHIHDSTLCTTYDEWNKTSIQSCTDRGMAQRSFAMLQPCGIDRFNGVEFVCCPQQGPEVKVSVQEAAKVEAPKPPRIIAGPPKKTKSADSYARYLHQSEKKGGSHKWNEHEYYMKAKKDMQKHHHDKISKMMQEWASARQRVQEMREKDPKGSEKLNKDITSRFQKMYEAEEVESVNEKKQLATLHQQRVQVELNEKKEDALDDFLDTLDDETSDSSEILRTLRHYMKILYKDRLHIVNRYKHLELSDPEQLDVERPQMAEHLRGLDKQFEEAVSKLDRVATLKQKILNDLQDYTDAYHSLDRNVAIILAQAAAVKKPKVLSATSEDGLSDSDSDIEDDDDDWDDEDDEFDDEKDMEDEDEDEDEDDWDDEDEEDWDDAEDDDDDDDDDEESEDERVEADDKTKTTVLPPLPTTKPPPAAPASEVKKEEDPMVAVDYFHGKEDQHAANIGKSEFALHQALIEKESSHESLSGGFSAAVPLGIAVGGMTVFIVIVVGVILMKRRQDRPHRPLRNLDLDIPISPEEKHVASMQMNGYENPTYKYFENNCNA